MITITNPKILKQFNDSISIFFLEYSYTLLKNSRKKEIKGSWYNRHYEAKFCYSYPIHSPLPPGLFVRLIWLVFFNGVIWSKACMYASGV